MEIKLHEQQLFENYFPIRAGLIKVLDLFAERLLIMLFLLVICGVVVCLFDMMVSYIAFVSPLHQGVGELKTGIYILATGTVVPPTLLPETIRELMYFIPFPHVVYSPARLLGQSAEIDSPDVISVLSSLCMWPALLAVIVSVLEYLRLKYGKTFEI